MAILNYPFLLISKVSKTKDQPGPFVLPSLQEGCCSTRLSHGLIIFLSAAFVRRKVKWVFKKSKSALKIKKKKKRFCAKYGV